MGDLIVLQSKLETLGTCPDCEGQEYYIHLYYPGRDLMAIKALECIDCGALVPINLAVLDTEGAKPGR